MKNIYFFILVLFITIAAPNRGFAFNITGHSEFDSCKAGNSYYITINAFNSGLSFVTYFGDGTNNTGYINGTNGFNNHYYPLPGIYTIKHVLKLNGNPVDSLSFTDTVACQNGFVTAYLDQNSNCTYDAGEPLLTTPLDIEVDSSGYKIDTMHIIGGTYRNMVAGKTYSMRILNAPSGATVTCPSTGIITNTIGFSLPTIFNFGLQCGSSSTFDIAEYVTVRAGRHTEAAEIVVTNTTCTPQSGTLTVNLSPKYSSYTYAFPSPATVSGTTLTWNLPSISAYSNYHIYVQYERPGGSTNWLTPGDTIQTSYYLTPTSGDVNPANNTVIRVDTVRASFDPNDKQVMPEGLIQPGTSLMYTVEFENDGNDTAQNIYILDTLSANVDINSIKVLSTSAKVMYTSIINAGAYNILKFDFPGIKLLDSSHHDLCRGMVVYSVNAKTGLTPGTVIPNRAGIYFDENEVVMTKTVENIIAPLSVGTNLIDKYTTIYPNPVHDVLTVKSAATLSQVRIINAMGQTMTETTINAKEARIDVKQLPAGVYYLILNGNDGVKTEKIIKE